MKQKSQKIGETIIKTVDLTFSDQRKMVVKDLVKINVVLRSMLCSGLRNRY